MFIIGLNMVGVFIKSAMQIVFANFWKVDVFIKNSYAILMSFLTVVIYSANAPVLYTVRSVGFLKNIFIDLYANKSFFSKEYRSKFNQQFPWLTRIFKKINAVAPQPEVNNITSTIRTSHCQLFIRRRGNELTTNDS